MENLQEKFCLTLVGNNEFFYMKRSARSSGYDSAIYVIVPEKRDLNSAMVNVQYMQKMNHSEILRNFSLLHSHSL